MSTVEFDETARELGEAGAAKVETAEVDGGARPEPAAAPPAAAAAPRGQIYTVLAREGVNAAEVINTALRKRAIGKVAPRRVEVIAPHGPSTSGGKKARQSITLVPVSGTGPAIMVGFLDVARKVAELRDFAAVAQQYRARFGSALEITEPEYQTLTKDLSSMLGTLAFQVTQVEEEEEDEAGSQTAASGLTGRTLVWVAAAVLAALIALFLLR